MLLYSKSFCGLPLAFSFNRGSPLTRNLLLPALSVALTAILWHFTCRHVPEILSAAAGDDGDDGEEYEYGQCVVKVRPATATFRCAAASCGSDSNCRVPALSCPCSGSSTRFPTRRARLRGMRAHLQQCNAFPTSAACDACSTDVIATSVLTRRASRQQQLYTTFLGFIIVFRCAKLEQLVLPQTSSCTDMNCIASCLQR